MMENGNSWNRSEEREINLRELIWKILYSWRTVIVSALVFAVLLGGYSYVKSSQSIKNAKNQKNVSRVELEEGLSTEEKEAVGLAEAIQQQITEKEEYQKESILMNVDAYHQDSKTLQYYVDTNYTWSLNKENEKDYVEELIDGYSAYIDTQDILKDIKEEVQWEEDDAYIGELLAVRDTDAEKSQHNTFIIYITGKDDKMVEKLSEAVEKAVAGYQSNLAKKIGAHELVLVDTQESVVVNESLAEKQATLSKSIFDLKTQYNTLTTEFNEVQKQILDGVEKEDLKETQVIPVKASISKKYILLGFVAGVFLSALWIVLGYVLNKDIKNADEIQEMYGIRILGMLEEEEENKKRFLSGVDRWLETKQKKEKWTLEEQRELIITNLSLTCKKENFSKVLITSSLHLSEKDKENIYFFIEKLEALGIHAVLEENMMRNVKAFEQMSEIENVVLVEKTEVTTYEALEKQLTICSQQGARILGIIILE